VPFSIYWTYYGDYATIDVIQHKDRFVEKLYRQALNYYPNAEAYLGLGILNQKSGAQREAIDILSQGLSHFPNDVRLNICLGVSLMNLADYDQALARFLEFPDEKDAVHFAARCYEAMGDQENAAALMDKYKRM
jgi:anaerobic magnesium-protoporphyrin IX monomethyl ester cyclase